MLRSSAEKIHPDAFSARVRAVSALRAVGTQADASRLNGAAHELRVIAERYGLAPNATIYGALADLTQIIGLLCEWRSTVLDAGIDAQRFQIAARERSAAWLAAHGENAALEKLKEVANEISALQSITGVPAIANKLSGIPLPIGIHTAPTIETLRSRMGIEFGPVEHKERPVGLAVAFVKFSIDGKPLAETHYVSPGETHDMDIEVRVSRWPKDATHMILEPVTVEPAGTYVLPTFILDAPLGEAGPFRLTAKGRVVLTVPQHFAARPFEFIYSARFSPSGTEQPVEVVGQRTLSLEGIDVARNPLTGYPAIDKKLIEMRNTMRVLPHMVQQELSDALTITFALCNYCGQVVQDNLFPSAISEKEFQRTIKAFLRTHPRIGAELEEHASAAGGITDLSFRGIRLELKSEPNQRLKLSDCSRYAGQAASYAVGTGKHIGVLCVLDCSPKQQAPFPVEDGIGIIPLQEASGSPVYVITFLLQGNLAKPSSLSR